MWGPGWGRSPHPGAGVWCPLPHAVAQEDVEEQQEAQVEEQEEDEDDEQVDPKAISA